MPRQGKDPTIAHARIKNADVVYCIFGFNALPMRGFNVFEKVGWGLAPESTCVGFANIFKLGRNNGRWLAFFYSPHCLSDFISVD